jgi:FlaA1/EpsC-like NDP-sugar epimerase
MALRDPDLAKDCKLPPRSLIPRIVTLWSTRMPRITWRIILIALYDALASLFAVLASCYLRFQYDEFWTRLPLLLKIIPYFVVLSIAICYAFRLTTTKWRFISLPDILNIVKASTVLALSLLVLDYIFVSPHIFGPFFFGKTTIVTYWLVQMFMFSVGRIGYRYFRYTRTLSKVRTQGASPTILVGRAADAELFLRGIESGAVKRMWAVGILSPSKADRLQSLRGISVLGTIDDLPDIVSDFERRGRPIAGLVMMPSAFEVEALPEATLTRARKLGLNVNRLPSLEGGEVPRLAPVAVEDLLLRPSVKIDYQRLKEFVRGKSVVVTGGGGSIGSEICERIVTFGVARLLILENSEPALHSVTEALALRFPDASISGHIADIRDRARIMQVMQTFKPDIIFHAAALKHVPILERDWAEGVKTNVFGTVNVADAAMAVNAAAMVMISTDKAIEPVSMLGFTKRFAEMYCQARDRERRVAGASAPSMRMISVRFGNVLASNGSVVPKFKAQIEAGGPVTVTHPEMVRYFMTIREACDLVVTAAANAVTSGHPDVSVYVLNMGQPVKIVDLAERMIRLSGLQPEHDIKIVFSGTRPGERLHEILFASEEPTVEIGIAGILAARPIEPPLSKLRQWLCELDKAIDSDQREAIEKVLKEAVPEFKAAVSLQEVGQQT